VRMRSTIGTYGMLGEYGLIWDTCSLVKSLQTSTGHSETTAAASWCKEQQSAQVQLREFGLATQPRVVCRVDNAGVVKQAVNTTNHSAAKHYRVAQAYIRQKCDNDEVLLVQIASDDNPADFFTKALDRAPFEKHRFTIMGPQKNPGEARAYVAATASVAQDDIASDGGDEQSDDERMTEAQYDEAEAEILATAPTAQDKERGVFDDRLAIQEPAMHTLASIRQGMIERRSEKRTRGAEGDGQKLEEDRAAGALRLQQMVEANRRAVEQTWRRIEPRGGSVTRSRSGRMRAN
jgi:hypothetical protein